MLSRITKIYIFDKMLFIADDDLDEEEDDGNSQQSNGLKAKSSKKVN